METSQITPVADKAELKKAKRKVSIARLENSLLAFRIARLSLTCTSSLIIAAEVGKPAEEVERIMLTGVFRRHLINLMQQAACLEQESIEKHVARMVKIASKSKNEFAVIAAQRDIGEVLGHYRKTIDQQNEPIRKFFDLLKQRAKEVTDGPNLTDNWVNVIPERSNALPGGSPEDTP